MHCLSCEAEYDEAEYAEFGILRFLVCAECGSRDVECDRQKFYEAVLASLEQEGDE